MEPRYVRASSPTSRRLAHGSSARTSTGTFGYPSSYDGYYGPRPSRDVIPDPRSSAERVVAPRLATRNYVDDTLPSRPFRDDYAIRPRRNTLETDPLPGKRPLGINTSSSNRPRPVIMSAIERPPSPMSKVYRPRGDESYYLQPASSSLKRGHQRKYSTGNEDLARLTTGAPPPRDRTDRSGYIRATPRREQRVYNRDAPSRSTLEADDDGGYEYTNRREQVYRDTAPRPRPRGDSYSGVRRPLSLTGMEDYLPRVPPTRDGRPPVTNRGFDKIGQIESSRQATRYNDVRPPDYTSDRGEAYEVPHRRPSTRKTVAIHQKPEEAYKPYGDDYDDGYDKRPHESRKNPVIESDVDPRAYSKREEPRKQEYDDAQTDRIAEEKPRKHRKHRHRHGDEDADKDRKDRGEGLLASGLAAAGAAGIAAEGAKHRHRRDRDARDAEDREPILSDGTMIDRDNDRGAHTTRDPADARKARDNESDEERRERHARRRERRRLEQEARDREEFEARERNADRPRDTLEPSRINMEPHRVNMEPPRVNMEPPRVNMEPPRVNVESSRANMEPPYMNMEPPRISMEPTRVNMEPSRANMEPPRVHMEPSLMEGAIQKQPSYESSPRSSPPQMLESSYRHRPRRRSPSSSSSTTSSTTSAPSSPRLHPVRVVSPPTSQEPEAPKKGILRPPREKFPEDPMPVREGVAPLKDAGKKGIPPNARWTKINRELVNPEALEAGNERFEERVDYVIVLRVLTKEEIQAYARKTQAIREERMRLGPGVGVAPGVGPAVGLGHGQAVGGGVGHAQEGAAGAGHGGGGGGVGMLALEQGGGVCESL